MNGWGSCDNFQDTIDATIQNAIDWSRKALNENKHLTSLNCCIECEAVIPEKRKILIVGCKYCVHCQLKHDTMVTPGYNRRGSKDSQLR